MGFFKGSIVLVLNLIIFCHGQETIDLSGDWVATDTSGKHIVLCSVPGGIYSDLMNDGMVIDDIFYGYGDGENSNWIPRTAWTYTYMFPLEEDFLAYENINIVFEGIDTFATIVINDKEVGTTKNMFVQYVFDIKSAIQAGFNYIDVRFQSPLDVAAQLSAIQNQSYPIPWHCPPEAYHGECYVSMIRKMQASFSWDWGPSFPSVGMWKNVSVEAYNSAKIRYVVSDVSKTDGSEFWTVNVDTYFADNKAKSIQGSIEYKITSLDGSEIISQKNDVNVQVNEFDEIVFTTSLNIPKDDVSIWWPNGYGSQPLYNLTVVFTDKQSSEITSSSKKIGFRTVELIQEGLSNGLSFYFLVNDVPIFMKGANEIPIHILPELGQDPVRIRYLLTSARDVNMNMIRVWGGGVYESDYFYDVADELGLLVWQDFMFACSLYPVNDDYLSNVIQEVRHNIKRISSHVSLAVYSGNNENEGVLANNWYGTADNYTLYKEDYVKLYITTIKSEFDRLTHNRSIFVSSSPTNGKESEIEGYVAVNPGNSLFGDVHYYSYTSDPFKPAVYPTPRFASEYGYQSLPSIETLLTANLNLSDWHVNSDFANYRQHHPNGNVENVNLISFQLKLPDVNAENFIPAYVYYLQVTQAQAIKVETEHYRNMRSLLDAQGQGYTMGALYWQLNDVWVAPTWSSIDYEGRWKMLHYLAKEFFKNVIVSGEIFQNQLSIYAVNDELTQKEVVIHVKVYNWNSLTPVTETEYPTDLPGLRSILAQTLSVEETLTAAECGSGNVGTANCFFHLSIVDQQTSELYHENYVFPANLYQSNIQKAKIEITSVQPSAEQQNQFDVTLTTDNVALFVWLDSHNVRGRFSDNGFLLVEKEKTVTFLSESDGLTVEDLQKVLTVTTVTDYA